MAPVPMADAKEGSNSVEKVVKSKQASAGKALPEFFEARIKKFEELQKEQAEQRVQKGGHPIKYALKISYQFNSGPSCLQYSGLHTNHAH